MRVWHNVMETCQTYLECTKHLIDDWKKTNLWK